VPGPARSATKVFGHSAAKGDDVGTWRAYLAFHTPADGPGPLPDVERVDGGVVAGWTYLTDRMDGYERLADAAGGLAGPALLSIVCDSDFSQITGFLDGVQQWEAFIKQDTAAALEVPTPALHAAQDESLLDRITLWAQAAGAPPVDRERLRDIFARHYLFADDGLLALEQLLGIISPEVRPFGDDQRIDYEFFLLAPVGDVVVAPETIAAIGAAVQGEANPYEPNEHGHRVGFFISKDREPADVLPTFLTALRRHGLPPATRIHWHGGGRWKSLEEFEG